MQASASAPDRLFDSSFPPKSPDLALVSSTYEPWLRLGGSGGGLGLDLAAVTTHPPILSRHSGSLEAAPRKFDVHVVPAVVQHLDASQRGALCTPKFNDLPLLARVVFVFDLAPAPVEQASETPLRHAERVRCGRGIYENCRRPFRPNARRLARAFAHLLRTVVGHYTPLQFLIGGAGTPTVSTEADAEGRCATAKSNVKRSAAPKERRFVLFTSRTSGEESHGADSHTVALSPIAISQGNGGQGLTVLAM